MSNPHGGYRHGIPGGKTTRVEAKVEVDRKDRWQAEAARRGYGTREFTAFLVEMIEQGIASTTPKT
jgi:hypothetical protein